MESYDEKDLERIKGKIREELKEEGMYEVDDEILVSMAQGELRREAMAQEEQKYRGWTIYFHTRRVMRMERVSLIKKLKRVLPDWGDFEEKNDKIDLTDPVYGCDVHIEFGNFTPPSDDRRRDQYHAKASSVVFAWKTYRNKEHRKVMFALWDKLPTQGEAYLDFEGYSKMIRQR